MFKTRLKIAAALLLVVGVLGAGVGWLRQPATAANLADEQELANQEDAPPEVYALFQLTPEPELLNEPQPGRVQSGEDFNLMKRTQAALLKSRTVLNTVLRKKAVAELPLVRQQRDAVAWLEKVLRVDFPNNAALLRVGMSGYKPDEMAAVVNAVADVYLEHFIDYESKKMFQRLDEVERLSTQAEANIYSKRQTLKRFKDTLGVVDLDSPASTIRQQLTVQGLLDCTRELRRVRLDMVALKVRLARMRAGKKGSEESQKSVNQLEDQLTILIEQEKLLVEEEKHLQDQADRASRTSIELKMKQEELTEVERVAKRLCAEKERLAIEARTARSRIRLVQRAEAAKAN
jgi:hypothetical protein